MPCPSYFTTLVITYLPPPPPLNLSAATSNLPNVGGPRQSQSHAPARFRNPSLVAPGPHGGGLGRGDEMGLAGRKRGISRGHERGGCSPPGDSTARMRVYFVPTFRTYSVQPQRVKVGTRIIGAVRHHRRGSEPIGRCIPSAPAQLRHPASRRHPRPWSRETRPGGCYWPKSALCMSYE